MKADDFEFGDFIDCTKIPGIDHRIIFLTSQANKVYYYLISSRIYKGFPVLCQFLEKCRNNNNCSIFKSHYKTENNEGRVINCHTRLIDAFFLDKNVTHFPKDSFISLKDDPGSTEVDVFEEWFKNGAVPLRSLTEYDIYKLKVALDKSRNISSNLKPFINSSANSKIKKIRANSQ